MIILISLYEVSSDRGRRDRKFERGSKLGGLCQDLLNQDLACHFSKHILVLKPPVECRGAV